MKLLKIISVLIASAALGWALGFYFRPKASTPGNHELAPVAPATPGAFTATNRVELAKGRGRGIRKNASALVTKLDRDLSMSTGVTRWLYWLEAIETAQPADFPELARLAEGDSAITRLVATKWAELFPRHFFDTIVAAEKTGDNARARDWAYQLFQQWPKTDPDAAISALKENTNSGGSGDWRMQVATTIFDQDPERGLRLMSEWHIENYGPSMKSVEKWAAANPRHAAEFALAHPAGYASRMTMQTIGKEWARQDPAGAIQFAMKQPGELATELGNSALTEWATRKLPDAAEWLAQLDEPARNRLSPSFLEAWAKQDPSSALTWCQQNLAGSSRSKAMSGVLKGAAEKNVVAASDLVLGMPPSPGRAEAAASVARKWFPDSLQEKPVPTDAIQWLKRLDPDSVKGVLGQISWGWSESDPRTMAEFMTTIGSEQVPSYVYGVMARKLARMNPADAMNWVGRLPQEVQTTAGSDAFGQWRAAQPEAAMKWLSELPANDPRQKPFFETAIQHVAYGSQAAEQLMALSEAERSPARPVIEKMSLPQERRNRLLEALKAP